MPDGIIDMERGEEKSEYEDAENAHWDKRMGNAAIRIIDFIGLAALLGLSDKFISGESENNQRNIMFGISGGIAASQLLGVKTGYFLLELFCIPLAIVERVGTIVANSVINSFRFCLPGAQAAAIRENMRVNQGIDINEMDKSMDKIEKKLLADTYRLKDFSLLDKFITIGGETAFAAGTVAAGGYSVENKGLIAASLVCDAGFISLPGLMCRKLERRERIELKELKREEKQWRDIVEKGTVETKIIENRQSRQAVTPAVSMEGRI